MSQGSGRNSKTMVCTRCFFMNYEQCFMPENKSAQGLMANVKTCWAWFEGLPLAKLGTTKYGKMKQKQTNENNLPPKN